MLSHEHRHWAYIWIPFFGAFIWFGTLLSMLITWFATGRPHYVSEDGNIAYISDVGADILKPLFVTGCVITAICFFASLVTERLLRHHGRLIPIFRQRERVFGFLAVLSSFIGGLGLILLSILDTKRHPSLHRLFLLIFMLGVAFSAIFTIVEYRWICQDFRYFNQLRRAYLMKAVIAFILIVLAVAFGVCLYKNGTGVTDAGAILEWTIALGFTFYLLTFTYDLRMSKGVRKGELSKEKMAPYATHPAINGNTTA